MIRNLLSSFSSTRLSTPTISIVCALVMASCGGGGAGGGGAGGGGAGGGGGGSTPPVTANDSCDTTPQSTALNGTLTFTGGNPNEQSFSLVNPEPRNGTVEIINATTGAYRYTPFSPENGARGMDTFGFRVDSSDGFDTAIQTVIVHPAIMTLGDSITRGTTDNNVTPGPTSGGYRLPLFNSLITAGYVDPETSRPAFDFVGGNNFEGSAIQGFDSDNEGHGGYRAIDISQGDVTPDSNGELVDTNYNGVFAALEQNPADIILLHIGTNDFLGPNTPAVARQNLEEILAQIDAWENRQSGTGRYGNTPGTNGVPVTLYLAKIIDFNPSGSAGDSTEVTQFNNMLAAVKADCDSNAIPCPNTINLVDMHTAFDQNPRDGIPDSLLYGANGTNTIHPSDVDNGSGISGYNRMAQTWFQAMVTGNTAANTNILAQCPFRN